MRNFAKWRVLTSEAEFTSRGLKPNFSTAEPRPLGLSPHRASHSGDPDLLYQKMELRRSAAKGLLVGNYKVVLKPGVATVFVLDGARGARMSTCFACQSPLPSLFRSCSA